MISGDTIAPPTERHPVRALQLAVGTRLREMLDAVVNEPMPADLLARLQQLDHPSRSRNPKP